MIKLVATDIDGTILGSSGVFTERLVTCIENLQAKGIKVVLVTGRMHSSAQLIKEDLGLDTPLVSYQGGLVKDDRNILYERYLTSEQTEKIINWAREEKIHINLYNDDVLYSEYDDYEIQQYSSYQQIGYTIMPFDKIIKNRVNKVLAIDYDNPERIDRFEKELPKLFPELYIIKSTRYFLEFSNPEGSKYHAVKFLQKYWNLKDDEILTIGDQNNDISLLKAGGIKVAMGNATEELKSVADFVTDSVYDDGFVTAIEKFVF